MLLVTAGVLTSITEAAPGNRVAILMNVDGITTASIRTA